MYHPEPSHSDTFHQELLELLIPLATEFYILGDFNLHLEKKPSPTTTIFLTARLAALEVADRALLNQCYHPPIGVGRMI